MIKLLRQVYNQVQAECNILHALPEDSIICTEEDEITKNGGSIKGIFTFEEITSQSSTQLADGQQLVIPQAASATSQNSTTASTQPPAALVMEKARSAKYVRLEQINVLCETDEQSLQSQNRLIVPVEF